MGSLAGLRGLDAADRLGRGPADGAGVFAEVDRDGLGGDVDGDDLAGVDAAEGDLLPGDQRSRDFLRIPRPRSPPSRPCASSITSSQSNSPGYTRPFPDRAPKHDADAKPAPGTTR